MVSLYRLICLADKYGAESVKEDAFFRLGLLAHTHPVIVAGVAIYFKNVVVARKALSFFDRNRHIEEHPRYNRSGQETTMTRRFVGKAYRIADIAPRWLEGVSGTALRSLLWLEGESSGLHFTWKAYADRLVSVAPFVPTRPIPAEV